MSELTPGDCADVLVVAITPRREDGRVDLEGAMANVRHLLAGGARILMPMCGTGLVYDATLEEYEAVVGAFVEAAGSRALVVPGIGPGFGRALEMGRIARGLGVAGAMIMPVVGPASARGVEEGMRRIAAAAALPILLYQRRLDIMPVEQVVSLCQLDEVVGLKYAVDDLASFRAIVDEAGEKAAMICGMAEDPAVEYLQSGAIGFSSGMANFAPRTSLALRRRAVSGDVAGAEKLRGAMVPFEDLRGEKGARYSASALHAAMDYAGLAGGPVVPFAEEVAAADLPRLRALVDQVMAIERSLEGGGMADE